MKVFLSYNSRDFKSLDAGEKSVPLQLKESLDSALDRRCTFLDREVIRAGDNWKSTIEESLARTQVLVVLAGPRFFEEEQFERLRQSDSVIRHELTIAQMRKDCMILPVFCGTSPPHTSGRHWPEGLEWLASIQWTEISLTETHRSINQIVNEVCLELARQALESVKMNQSLTNCIAVVAEATEVERQAMAHLLSISTVAERFKNDTRVSLDLLIKLFNSGAGGLSESAITGRGEFANTSLLLRVIFVLSIAKADFTSFPPRLLEQLDHALQKSSAKAVIDIHIIQFVSVAIQRAREHCNGIELNSSTKLSEFYKTTKLLKSSTRRLIQRGVVGLVQSGICYSTEDIGAFLGKGQLRRVTPRVRTKGNRSPRSGAILPSSRASRVLRQGKSTRSKRK